MTEEQESSKENPEGAENAAESLPEATEPARVEESTTFPRAYVERLRAENAEHRTRAKMADTFKDALRTAMLQQGSQGILHDPLDWSDDFEDSETGLPDVEKIKAAAEKVAEERPHLARVRGDVGQGHRGEESSTVDLAQLLRAGA